MIGSLVERLERLLGPRVDPDDGAVSAEVEARRASEIEQVATQHRKTLRRVNRVLSQSQLAIADAIDDTGQALEQLRRSHRT